MTEDEGRHGNRGWAPCLSFSHHPTELRDEGDMRDTVWCGVYGRGEAPVERRKGRETHHTTHLLPSFPSVPSVGGVRSGDE